MKSTKRRRAAACSGSDGEDEVLPSQHRKRAIDAMEGRLANLAGEVSALQSALEDLRKLHGELAAQGDMLSAQLHGHVGGVPLHASEANRPLDAPALGPGAHAATRGSDLGSNHHYSWFTTAEPASPGNASADRHQPQSKSCNATDTRSTATVLQLGKSGALVQRAPGQPNDNLGIACDHDSGCQAPVAADFWDEILLSNYQDEHAEADLGTVDCTMQLAAGSTTGSPAEALNACASVSVAPVSRQPAPGASIAHGMGCSQAAGAPPHGHVAPQPTALSPPSAADPAAKCSKDAAAVDESAGWWQVPEPQQPQTVPTIGTGTPSPAALRQRANQNQQPQPQQQVGRRGQRLTAWPPAATPDMLTPRGPGFVPVSPSGATAGAAAGATVGVFWRPTDCLEAGPDSAPPASSGPWAGPSSSTLLPHTAAVVGTQPAPGSAAGSGGGAGGAGNPALAPSAGGDPLGFSVSATYPEALRDKAYEWSCGGAAYDLNAGMLPPKALPAMEQPHRQRVEQQPQQQPQDAQQQPQQQQTQDAQQQTQHVIKRESFGSFTYSNYDAAAAAAAAGGALHSDAGPLYGNWMADCDPQSKLEDAGAARGAAATGGPSERAGQQQAGCWPGFGPSPGSVGPEEVAKIATPVKTPGAVHREMVASSPGANTPGAPGGGGGAQAAGRDYMDVCGQQPQQQQQSPSGGICGSSGVHAGRPRAGSGGGAGPPLPLPPSGYGLPWPMPYPTQYMTPYGSPYSVPVRYAGSRAVRWRRMPGMPPPLPMPSAVPPPGLGYGCPPAPGSKYIGGPPPPMMASGGHPSTPVQDPYRSTGEGGCGPGGPGSRSALLFPPLPQPGASGMHASRPGAE